MPVRKTAVSRVDGRKKRSEEKGAKSKGTASVDGLRERKVPKSMKLQIRLTAEDYERLTAAADAVHLDVSAWARQALLKALHPK